MGLAYNGKNITEVQTEQDSILRLEESLTPDAFTTNVAYQQVEANLNQVFLNVDLNIEYHQPINTRWNAFCRSRYFTSNWYSEKETGSDFLIQGYPDLRYEQQSEGINIPIQLNHLTGNFRSRVIN